jgi:hypothetical protein
LSASFRCVGLIIGAERGKHKINECPANSGLARFDREDVVMGKVLAQGLAWGYRVEDLVFYVQAGEEIVDREMKGLKDEGPQHQAIAAQG